MSSDVWPTNVVDVLVEELLNMEDVEATTSRGLTEDDTSGGIGVYVVSWAPPADAYVIGQADPILNVYTFGLDLMIKALDRAEAATTLSVMTKRLRTMLYRDDDLQVRLKQLSETAFGRTETYKRMRVTRQDYRTGTLGGVHLAASTTTLTVETDSR